VHEREYAVLLLGLTILGHPLVAVLSPELDGRIRQLERVCHRLGDGLEGLEKEGVFYARAKEIRVESSPGSLEFTVDGEVIGDEPAMFAVMPHALKVVVGPGYVPEL
jgi:diacylglycerol kinase family enzyme